MNFFNKIFAFKNKANSSDTLSLPTSKEFKKVVNDNLFKPLKPYGFKRNGYNYSRDNGSLIYYIQIQSSTTSTSKVVKLTLNLGIVSKEILAKENKTNSGIGHSHWRQRIGRFKDNARDYWWIIDSFESADKSSKEIVELILNKVLKEWENINSTSDLKKYWVKGNDCGLTEYQRKYYLDLAESV